MESTELLKCGCCGILEECTLEYIACVKERFGGVWVCGLCAEAVKDEQARLGLGIEAAIMVHSKFREVYASVEQVPTIDIAHSLVKLLIKKIISTSTNN